MIVPETFPASEFQVILSPIFKLSFHRCFFENIFAVLCQIEDSAEPN